MKCKICSRTIKTLGGLSNHIRRTHKMSSQEYYDKYINDGSEGICLYCETNKTSFNTILKGYRKYCIKCKDKRDERFFILKYGEKQGKQKWYDLNKKKSYSNSKEGLIERHGKEKAEKICKSFTLTKEEKIKKWGLEKTNEWYKRIGYSTRIEYWTDQGYSDEEARKLLKKRQTTFSKKICIEKYGEEQGLKRWQKRQDKWQETLKAKPIEERDRILRAKMFNGKSFSNISQELFWSVYEHIKHDFNSVYFATMKNGVKVQDDSFNEYRIIRADDRVAFLDFYIRDSNKVIEFDGDYWHGERRGNIENDKIREEMILQNNPELDILHIKECDYNNNKEQTINRCVDFLNS